MYQIDCNGGKYGKNCSVLCGHCQDKEQCHYIHRSCPNGCDDGYQGGDCIQGINNALVTCKETGIYFEKLQNYFNYNFFSHLNYVSIAYNTTVDI